MGWSYAHADLPAPEGPIIKILSAVRDSSDAIGNMCCFGWSCTPWVFGCDVFRPSLSSGNFVKANVDVITPWYSCIHTCSIPTTDLEYFI